MRRKVYVCRICGQRSHWAAECPKLGNAGQGGKGGDGKANGQKGKVSEGEGDAGKGKEGQRWQGLAQSKGKNTGARES